MPRSVWVVSSEGQCTHHNLNSFTHTCNTQSGLTQVGVVADGGFRSRIVVVQRVLDRTLEPLRKLRQRLSDDVLEQRPSPVVRAGCSNQNIPILNRKFLTSVIYGEPKYPVDSNINGIKYCSSPSPQFTLLLAFKA